MLSLHRFSTRLQIIQKHYVETYYTEIQNSYINIKSTVRKLVTPQLQ